MPRRNVSPQVQLGESVKSRGTDAAPAIVQGLPMRPESKKQVMPVDARKAELAVEEGIASFVTAKPKREVHHETFERKIPGSSEPQRFEAPLEVELQKKQAPKEKEASKERKHMRRKWFGLAQGENNEEGLSGNANVVSQTGIRAAEAGSPAGNGPAETAGESAASSPGELLCMEDIYRAAGISNPRRGYSINKVVEMLRSEHVRGLSKEMKRAALLMALDAAGISVDEVLQDAKVRREAIDTYEVEQRTQLEAQLARKAEENIQIQAELERVKAQYMARVRRNLDGVAREKATFSNWLTMKQQECQSMAEAADLCLKTGVSEAANGALAEVSLVDASAKPV
jgi:hypothetical protein